MKNENCPSFDCGGCITYPSMYIVECGGKETKNCKWLNFDFKNISYAQYMKEQKGRK